MSLSSSLRPRCLLFCSHSSDLQRQGCWRSVRSWPSWQARWPHRWSAATRPAPTANQIAACGSCWWSHSLPESPEALPPSWRRSREPGTYRSYITHTKNTQKWFIINYCCRMQTDLYIDVHYKSPLVIPSESFNVKLFSNCLCKTKQTERLQEGCAGSLLLT